MTKRWYAVALASAAFLLTSVSDGAAGNVAGFGRCLRSKGAVFYGTSWCPHCQKQREMLGDAMDSVKYVECSENGERGATTAACKKADVDSYPTWIFADGSRANGRQSLEDLAAKTGCELPRAAGER